VFVRFRETPHRLQLSLVETRRIDGKVRHEHVASLGSIAVPASTADRIVFWQRLHARLARLSNRVDAEAQAKILGSVYARIPMPNADEQRALQLENAKADQNFWNTVADLHGGTLADQQHLKGAVERTIASGEGEIAKAKENAAAAAERISSIERGEGVDGGLGKPLTMEDFLKAGFTPADLRHMALLGSIPEQHWEEFLQENWRLREKIDRSLSTRAARTILRRHNNST
jgi:hypothetical protein